MSAELESCSSDGFEIGNPGNECKPLSGEERSFPQRFTVLSKSHNGLLQLKRDIRKHRKEAS